MVDIWLYEDAEHVVNMFVEVRDKHIGINGNFYLACTNGVEAEHWLCCPKHTEFLKDRHVLQTFAGILEDQLHICEDLKKQGKPCEVLSKAWFFRLSEITGCEMPERYESTIPLGLREFD